jgi:GNAT superfamily N-acetyltransferase
VIRRGGQLDVPFMRSMLTHAYNWHVTLFDTDVPLARYVDGWGRPGDTVLVAMDGGHRVGAGWYRLFRPSAPGYGFVDERTPELTIAVVPGRRGEGIGQELLAGLLERARGAGHQAVSVSVEKDHPEVQIYEQAGFEQVRETEHALIMRHVLG